MTRVLVVDDQKVSRTMVASVLRAAGYAVETAESGPQGIERARTWRPDLVVLDVQMPGMDGFEVVERLQGDPRTASLPVVLLTAQTPSDELVVRGLGAGAFDFLNKGCSRAELLARVGVMARVKRGYDELSAVARISGLPLEAGDPQAVAGGVAAQAADSFRADAAVLDVPGDGEAPDLRAGAGIDAADPRFFVLVDQALERVHCSADAGAARLGPGIDGWGALAFGAGAAVCVPRPGGGPTLLAVFRAGDTPFRDEELRLLEVLGRQATLALDNAMLHAQTRQQARTLHEQAAALERAIADKSRFFASMSHELRTPINAILGYGELLREGVYGALDGAQEGAMERVVRSGRHLLDLVNDVLDISKLEAGKLEIMPEPTDVGLLLHEVAATVELQAREKGLELGLRLPSGLVIGTDPGRVRQIVLNLLSNAVKFTAEGAVRASAQAVGRWVEIEVADTGPGIAPEDHERVFLEFEQTRAAVGQTGTGLGLPISRRLAELLGGSLTLRSAAGEGARFTLRLPLVPPWEEERGADRGD